MPLLDSHRYLDLLLRRFATESGRVELRTLRSLNEVDLNGSGLRSRELAGDFSLYPICGQMTVATAPVPLPQVVDDTSFEDLIYVISRCDECVLGRTAQMHSADLDKNLPTREGIPERCRRLKPRLEEVL